MPIRGQCPGCGREFQAPDKLSGKRVKCPNCSAVISLGGARRQTIRQAPSKEQTSQAPAPSQQGGEKQAAWYVKTAAGEQLGPISKTQLDGLVAEERLDGFCQVRREDWQQWKWAEAVYPQFALSVEPEVQPEGPKPPAQAQPQTVAVEQDSRLRPCPDCGQTVSKRASQCPSCGCPLDAVEERSAAPVATAQPVYETRPAAAFAGQPVAGKPSRARLWVVVGAVSAVLLIGVVAVGAVWMLKSMFSVDDELVQSLAAQTQILPQQPSQPKLQPEEMQRWMEEAAAAAAKQVDDLYGRAHLAGSGLERLQKSADLLRSIIEDPLGDPGDDLTTAAETEVEPYQSQYQPLYEECISYIRDNIAAGQLDRATVRELADRWADGKRDPLDKQLLEQILVPQEP